MVKVSLKNHVQLLSKRTAPDYHYVSLIIGNADNSVIFIQKLMWEKLLRHHTFQILQKIDLKNELIVKMHLFVCFPGTRCSWGVAAGRGKLRWKRAQKDVRSVSTSSVQNMVEHGKTLMFHKIASNDMNCEHCALWQEFCHGSLVLIYVALVRVLANYYYFAYIRPFGYWKLLLLKTFKF